MTMKQQKNFQKKHRISSIHINFFHKNLSKNHLKSSTRPNLFQKNLLGKHRTSSKENIVDWNDRIIDWLYYGLWVTIVFYFTPTIFLGPLLTDPEPFDSTKRCKREYGPYSYRKIRDTNEGDCYCDYQFEEGICRLSKKRYYQFI